MLQPAITPPMVRRLYLFLPMAGLLALGVFAVTLSRGVFPGRSASLVAAAAGLVPPSGAAHPVFSRVAQAAGRLELFTLPVRLNLFSALCGALCAALLYHLVSRLILRAASEDAGGSSADGLMESAVLQPRALPEVERYNWRVTRFAALGGLLAAGLFALSAPAWSAATRLDPGCFHLLLLLASLCLFPAAALEDAPATGVWPRLALSACLFALGLADSAAFLLALPAYAYYLFMLFAKTSRRAALVVTVLAGGLAAGALVCWAFLQNAPSEAPVLERLITLARALPSYHYRTFRTFWPRSGWMLLAVQVGVPAAVLLFGRQLLFRERRANTVVALVLVGLAALPTCLNLSVSPFRLLQGADRLPVFAAAVIAAALGAAFASGLVFNAPDDAAVEPDALDRRTARQQRRMAAMRGFVGAWLLASVAAAVATPLCNFRAASARQGAFADALAREMVGTLGERTCLITNGMLDHHLQVQALLAGRALDLVSLRARPYAYEVEQTRRFIAESPLFATRSRQRLQNALSISPTRFVMEWFRSDPQAGEHALVFATPDLWTACGFRPLPEGLAFGGSAAEGRLDVARLERQSRAFAGRALPALAAPIPAYSSAALLQALLRARAGFAANELGVLLEEEGALLQAYDAYGRAVEFDPGNVSAAFNAYALASLKGVHPDSAEALKKRLKRALGQASAGSVREVAGLLQRYGSIHQPAFYQQQAAQWAALGARSVSQKKLQQAVAFSAQTGASACVEKAVVLLHAGQLAEAEACYRSALKEDPACAEALAGLCSLMIRLEKPLEAEQWLQQALAAGVDPQALRYQTVSVALLKKEHARALKLLQEATRDVPHDLRYWALLADLLLARGDIQYVERQLLPDMQQAVKSADHYLVYAIRGMALRAKGAEFHKEARQSLLKALSLNASLPDVWTALLQLDFTLGGDVIEADAKRLLSLDPDHALANYLLGALLLSRGAWPEAEDFLRRSAESVPTPEAYNDLAESLRLQNKLAEAEAAVCQALQLSPNLAPASDTLANVLFGQGRYQAAAEQAARAVAAQPAHAPYQLTLLHALVQLKDRAAVQERLRLYKSAGGAVPKSLQLEIDALGL